MTTNYKVVGYSGNLNSIDTCIEYTYLTDSYDDAINRTSRYDAAIIYHCAGGFSKYQNHLGTYYKSHGDVKIVFDNLSK